MATYTYECKKCGEFDVTQSMKEDAYTKCPKCGGAEIKRLIGKGSGFIIKGSGFYETDYKKKEVPSSSAKAMADKACDTAAKPECKTCPHAKG
ncbi:MAG: hypothetical protein PF450_05940, partial [Bacteroidales bacterium]|nr:hypothetical protein [Bacteroidales bacterium]